MTPYERYMAAVERKGASPDFVPRTPILMQYAAEYIGSDYAAFASDYRVLVEANLRCAEDFGMDQVSCISDPYRETEGFGGQIEYLPNAPPRSTHPLRDAKDLDGLPHPDPTQSVRMRDRVDAAAAFKQQCGRQYSILGWVEGPAAEAADLRDVTTFLMDLMEDEPFACELMDRCLETAIAFADAQVHAGTDTIGVGDAIASQVSPDAYERLIQPREKKLVTAIREMGAYAKLHICGNITHLLPGIADLGVDILDVDHMVDMATVRSTVGNNVVLAGNIDPVAGVKNGTPDSIRDDIVKTYETVGVPYLVNAGCEIPSGTPPENLRALCEPMPPRA